MRKKLLLIVCLFMVKVSIAQKIGWQYSDFEKDTIVGISLGKTYSQLLKNKKSESVIVAIIDSGIDTIHEDLKSILWADVKTKGHGINYLAIERGKEDITNLTRLNKTFYDSLSYTVIPDTYRSDYQSHHKLDEDFRSRIDGMRSFINELELSGNMLDVILGKMKIKTPMLSDFKNYKPQNKEEKQLLDLIIEVLPQYPDFITLRKMELDLLLQRAHDHLSYGLNLKNLDTENDKSLSDANIQYDPLGLMEHQNFSPFHGTHVAGIIAASRGNGIGVDGIADNVRIMMLKVTSNIRELRDSNLAAAIRFATDNGAKIINLSFGKPYSWNKKEVDDAVKYAMKHDVLIVHAAGNSGKNLDQISHFPNPIYADGSGNANAWLEVGASGSKDDSLLVATFSNYGRNSVDIFAPGVQIYSTIPGNRYKSYDGSSMAAPMVAGVAALIREYYPHLTAVQVREIIINSAMKINHNVVINENGQNKSVPFSAVCSSSGIVNAYNALKMASLYKKNLVVGRN